MNNLRKEFQELKQMLANGEINQETYSKEIDKLTAKSRINSTLDTLAHVGVSSHQITYVQLALTFIIILVVWIVFFKFFYIKKPIEYVKSLTNLPSPIQTSSTGETSMEVNGVTVDIDFIANYEITGLVVGTYKYSQTSTLNQLSPIDIGISWGFLADYNDRMSWHSSGNRFLTTYTAGTWYQELGHSTLTGYFSNNHIIPSNNDIKKLVKKVKVGDYIKLKGYLVNATYPSKDGDSTFYYNSSTSRLDTGDQACEVLYVTDIAWLKLKN